MAAALKRHKACQVVGVDLHPSNPNFALDAFYQCDLNRGLPPLRLDNLITYYCLTSSSISPSRSCSWSACAMPSNFHPTSN